MNSWFISNFDERKSKINAFIVTKSLKIRDILPLPQGKDRGFCLL